MFTDTVKASSSYIGRRTGVVGPLFGQMSHVQMSAQIIFQLVHTDEQIHIYADPIASQM